MAITAMTTAAAAMYSGIGDDSPPVDGDGNGGGDGDGEGDGLGDGEGEGDGDGDENGEKRGAGGAGGFTKLMIIVLVDGPLTAPCSSKARTFMVCEPSLRSAVPK